MPHLATMYVIHGALAARNVKVAENYVTKISDFGLSKAIHRYNGVYKKTWQNWIPWAWMAIRHR